MAALPPAAKRIFPAVCLVLMATASVHRIHRARALERAVHDGAEELEKLSAEANRAEALEQRIRVIKAYIQAEQDVAASRRVCPGFFSRLQKTLGLDGLQLETLETQTVGGALQASATVRSHRKSDLSEWRRLLRGMEAGADGDIREVSVTAASVSNDAFHETVSMTYLWKAR